MRSLWLYISCFFSILSYAQTDTLILEKTEIAIPRLIDEHSIGASTDSLLNTKYSTHNQVVKDRVFASDFQSKYQEDDFDYSKTKARKSLWEKFIFTVEKYLNRLFGDFSIRVNDWTTKIFYLFCGIVIIAVVYLLIRVIMKKEGKWFFSKKDRKINPEVNPLEENIHEIDFEKTILKYEKQQEYRMAIRYQFLWYLKSLSDQEKIDWHPKKTNSDYLNELNGENRKNFEKAVYIFDHIWYGEFPIDEMKYHNLLPFFQSLKSTTHE